MRVLAAIVFVLMALAAHAQNMQRALVVSSCGSQTLGAGPLTNLTMNPQGQLCIGGSVGPTYSGPGDVVASATAWYGLRAYNGAYAAAAGKSVNLRRASDNATCDFAVSSTGGLGVSVATCATGLGSTPAAFATQDATASCTIATTTATCTGASSTPHVGSTIAGAGVTQPCYATAVGTFTAGAGTVTLAGTGASPCGTIGSATTLTFTYGLYATTIYDQSGARACAGSVACDLLQATAAKQPQVLPSCLNGNPCFGFVSANAQTLLSTFSFPTVSTFTASAVSERIGAPAFERVIGNGGGSILVYYNNTANTAVMTQGTALNATVSDNAWHALQAIFAAGATSFWSVDGVAGSAATAGAGAWSSIIAIAGSSTQFLNGNVTEAGIWSSAFTPTQATSMCHNQFAYWGTSVSC